MPACATREMIPETPPISNLFLPVPDTDFRAFLDEVAELLRFAPEIVTAIEGDLDAHALAKKKLRLEDRRFFENQTEDLPELQIEESEPSNDENDAKILTGLLMRVDRLGQKLDAFGLENFRQGWVPRWLEEMDKLEFQICLVAGKANSRAKLKQGYRQLLRKGKKALAALKVEFNAFESAVQIDAFAPSRRILLQRVIAQIRSDLSDAQRVIDYASDRVFHEKKLPSTEKVLAYNCCRSILLRQRQREKLEPAA